MPEKREIILVEKPEGLSSFGVIKILRQKLGVRKMGHAGTLDPFATGLLIIGIGHGTKRMKEFEVLPKTYVMDVLLGRSTDTGDPDGKTIAEKKVSGIGKEDVEKILKEMEGDIELPIPSYSAVKHKGIPLYKYARRGIAVERKKRKTRIFGLKLMNFAIEGDKVLFRAEMKAEKGTYARAVGEEVGRRIGAPAMLTALRRTKIGDIAVEDAKQLKDF
ncbi:MAG: tRNA pseudouridine(55) synthase TruB [Candidatus Liptonbacteria bacterium]|nr:tRNA pseudouridine(55) synthase TruB [Candidatus Liptonbacteria bacterium]